MRLSTARNGETCSAARQSKSFALLVRQLTELDPYAVASFPQTGKHRSPRLLCCGCRGHASQFKPRGIQNVMRVAVHGRRPHENKGDDVNKKPTIFLVVVFSYPPPSRGVEFLCRPKIRARTHSTKVL
ncbi:unnamed protein product [Ectocarpus sp. 4 AP-2014]